MKKLSPNVPPMLIALLLLLLLLMPGLPSLVKSALPFPQLNDSTYLEGSFVYEGDWPQVRVPRYFVVNSLGKHEFQCGYLGGRHRCFTDPKSFAGQKIQVWGTFLFGAIQIVPTTRPGDKAHPFDISGKDYTYFLAVYRTRWPHEKSDINIFGVLIMLGFIGWFLVKEVWRRQESSNQIDH